MSRVKVSRLFNFFRSYILSFLEPTVPHYIELQHPDIRQIGGNSSVNYNAGNNYINIKVYLIIVSYIAKNFFHFK